mmetsp:Transcript_70414/g.152971  ORF Transcript_70414/g.152971 Transcript_70414/m.152971 type:complete len:104 (-) Transcript_70414:125-436(-)
MPFAAMWLGTVGIPLWDQVSKLDGAAQNGGLLLRSPPASKDRIISPAADLADIAKYKGVETGFLLSPSFHFSTLPSGTEERPLSIAMTFTLVRSSMPLCKPVE